MADDNIHRGTSGDDTLTGGAGADVFVFEPETLPTNSNDVITDFTDGEDVIDLSRFSGITDFDDLNITSDGTDVIIDLNEYGGGTIRLEGFDIANLNADDFLFRVVQTGGDDDDTLTGGRGDDELYGGA
ncbi:MAG: M10 family metallopeptidase C-terminal domain-containing protein, partial [Spirochaetaceae bacterium]|nr:M10 family metallopeptidase C-terminal domain-containing protein [Spirochaetaceae bacterium]